MAGEARIKGPMYRDASHNAVARLTRASSPAEPRVRCRFAIAAARIWLTDPGATWPRWANGGGRGLWTDRGASWPRLANRVWMVPGPARSTREITTSRAGKIDSTLWWGSAAARRVRWGAGG